MVDAEGAPRKFDITDFLEPAGRAREKADGFRKQQEFGARKRIKP
jgi:hypothetical protein